MSPTLLRQARWYYGAIGLYTGVARVPYFGGPPIPGVVRRPLGLAVTGVTVIRGMSALIPGALIG